MATDVTSTVLEVVVGGEDGTHVRSTVLEVVVAPDVDSTQVHSVVLEVVVAPDLPTGPGGAGPDCGSNELGDDLWWALDVDIAGVEHHFATRAGTAGGTLYRSGLGGLSLSKLDDLTTAVDVEIETDDDWATSFGAAQWLLDGGRASLYLVVTEGGTQRRILWVEGRVDGVSWVPGDPLSLEIRPDQGDPTIPPSREKIDEYTRPAQDSDDSQLGSIGATAAFELWEASVGKYYPLIVGYPGHVPNANAVCVVPVPVAQASWQTVTVDTSDSEDVPEVYVFALAGGTIDAEKVWVLETGITTTRTTASGKQTQVPQADPVDVDIHHGPDAIGQRCAWYHAAFDPEEQSGEPALYVGFSKADGFGGGILHNGRVVNGASDIFEWLVQRYSGVRLDLGRHRVHAAHLNRYLFDLVVNETIPAIDWFERDILRFIPGAIVRGPEGVYLAHLPIRGSRVDAVASLVEGGNAQRVSMAVTSTADVVNELTFSWGRLRDGNAYHRTRILTAQQGRVSLPLDGAAYEDGRALAEGLCIVSQRAYGEVRPGTLQLQTIWDPGTAQRVAEDYVVRRAFPERTFRYTVGAGLHRLAPGDLVTLTDVGLAISERACTVVDVVVSPPLVEVALRPIRTLTSYL